MPAADPIRDKKDIKRFVDFFREKRSMRNCLLMVMGIHTALRVGDILRLKWSDVYDAKKGNIRKSFSLMEAKTGKKKTVALNKEIMEILALYAREGTPPKPDDYLFKSRIVNRPITRTQAYRIIQEAAAKLGIEGNISCHSLRKTFGYHAWKESYPLVVIMDIYNHSSYETTRRYLGVSQDDQDLIYLKMKFLE